MSIEAMKQALEFIQATNRNSSFLLVPESNLNKVILALRQAIEQAEQAPICAHGVSKIKCDFCNQAEHELATILPDGSAFAVMSSPLPKDHWLYAERQYNDGEYEPVELGNPILTHELRDAVVSAVRYAIRGATNCGKDIDFDPDALVQNAVYALCGPYGQVIKQAEQAQPVANNWSVFNTGAEVRSGMSLADAVAELTTKRMERGWSAVCVINKDNPPLYTAPPQRKPLTDEEISKVAAPFYGVQGFRVEAFARAVEAKLRGKYETTIHAATRVLHH